MRVIPRVSRDLTYDLLGLALASGGKDKDSGGDSQLRQWSSIIGIVTAIIGNVLISFALNTQRYAHIRLEKEHNESLQLLNRQRSGDSSRRRGYGTTTQEHIAEERVRLNKTAPGPGGPTTNARRMVNGRPIGHAEDGDEEERQPLKGTFESDDILAPSEEEEDDLERKSYLKSGYWWFGIILMTVGEAGNFLAYGFAPASIVSPLGVVALISNCLIAPLMLKERFRQRDFWGVLVAIGGAVTVVLSAKHAETKMGPNDLWDAINRWEFLVYLGITAGAITALMIASPKYGDTTILIDLGLVGLFGGYTAISTKGVASLLSDTLWRTFTFPITYLLVLVLVLSALMQIRYVNRALQNFSSTQVIPTQFVMFTISVIIGSAVLYREFESTTVQHVGEFVGGCLLTFFGVYLITSGRNHSEDESGDDDQVFQADQPIYLVDEEAGIQDSPIQTQKRSREPSTLKISPSHATNVEAVPYKPSMLATTDPSVPSVVTSTASSAVLESETNPWASSREHPPSTPPPFPRSQSAVDYPEDPSTPFFTPLTSTRPAPIARTPSAPSDPQTPTRTSRTTSPPKPDPGTSLRTQGPAPTPLRSHRGSIARLTPGPFLTPLSSSLSVMVADSLRKAEGRGLMRTKSKRGRVSIIPRDQADNGGTGTGPGTGATSAEELSRQPTRDVGDEDGVLPGAEPGAGPVRQTKSRLRSMSESLGKFIGGVGGDLRRTRRKGGGGSGGGDEDGSGGGSSRQNGSGRAGSLI